MSKPNPLGRNCRTAHLKVHEALMAVGNGPRCGKDVSCVDTSSSRKRAYIDEEEPQGEEGKF